ncbi:hypothetical protein [Ruegeria profundi]|nr:hypothetical protein [Ruegeria profundi]MCA0929912.1 hypothetical protein [Ruegeria profundi]
MRFTGLILTLVLLAACEPTGNPRPQPETSTGGSGISISGYGRIGVSTTR